MKITFSTLLIFFVSLSTVFAQQPGERIELISEEKIPLQWEEIKSNDPNFPQILNPVTFSDYTKVYALPDTTSEVLFGLQYDSPVELMRQGSLGRKIVEKVTRTDSTTYIHYGGDYFRWYEIIYGNTKGYVVESDIVTQSLTGKNNDRFYIKNNQVLKYSVSKQRFDTLPVWGIFVQEIEIHSLKHVNMLFRITSEGAFCGGGRSDQFVIDANDSLFTLTTGGYVNTEDIADEHYYKDIVYLPLQFFRGKILLVENGDVGSIFDQSTGTLNVHPFPAKLNIPKQDLVVRKTMTEKVLLDAKQKPLLDKQGNYRTRVTHKTEFYRWTGRRMVLVDTVLTKTYLSTSTPMQ
ncbi:MAG: hypothetical protein V4658_13085 [Bacteroidota bacterium]